MQNLHFFDKFLLELLANLSEKGFVKKFSFPWILQVVKVRCFQFYLIKCPFFQISNFEILQNQSQLKSFLKKPFWKHFHYSK